MEELEPGQGNPDNLTSPQEQQTQAETQFSWGELSDDDKKLISDKGFKSPAAVLKSYREIEKSFGTRVPIPEDADAEGWSKLYTRLGKPQTADKYEFKEIQDQDKPLIEDFRQRAFSENLTQKQVE